MNRRDTRKTEYDHANTRRRAELAARAGQNEREGRTMETTKFLARVNMGGSDMTQCGFDDVNEAIKWLGDCQWIGTVYRMSTSNAVYQVERGKINFDRRMKKEGR